MNGVWANGVYSGLDVPLEPPIVQVADDADDCPPRVRLLGVELKSQPRRGRAKPLVNTW